MIPCEVVLSLVLLQLYTTVHTQPGLLIELHPNPQLEIDLQSIMGLGISAAITLVVASLATYSECSESSFTNKDANLATVRVHEGPEVRTLPIDPTLFLFLPARCSRIRDYEGTQFPNLSE